MRTGILLLWAVQGFAAFNLTWGVPAVSLDSNPPIGDHDDKPTIAVDPLGNAAAVWGRTSGGGAIEDIWASCYYHEARVWTGATKISGGTNASNASIAMDQEGNVIAVWEEGFPTQIFYRTLTRDGIWTPSLSDPPLSVSESVHAQTYPQIAIDQAGNALVIWNEFSSKKSCVQSAKKPLDSSWTYLGTISSGVNHAEIRQPKPLVLNAAGDGIAVWEESDQKVYGARYVLGNWLEPIEIGTGKEPSAAIDAEGNELIVWNQDGVIQSKSVIGGVLSEPSIALSNPVFVSQRPQVGMDDVGNAIVVYERYDSAAMHKFITGANKPSGSGAWSTPVDISAPSPASVVAAGYPLLSINSIGDGVAIWKEYNGTNLVIQGAGYSLGTWSFIQTLSSSRDNSGSSVPGYDMSISLNVAGNIIAIWPEDPAGTHTQHIKAAPGVGLAIEGPLPPVPDPKDAPIGIGTGVHVVRRFPAHSDHVHILDWVSPGGVAYYKIYRDSLFSPWIGTSTSPHYEDHQREPGKQVIYLITSVDAYGHESGPTAIIVQPN